VLSHKGEVVEEWTDLHFFRPLGMRLVRLLAPTGVSADQVTVAALLVGLAAGHLFFYRSAALNALGLLLFVLSDILDSADGQLARLRGNSTRMGRVLDGISDNLRFVNLYVHLIARLLVAHAMGPAAGSPGATAQRSHLERPPLVEADDRRAAGSGGRGGGCGLFYLKRGVVGGLPRPDALRGEAFAPQEPPSEAGRRKSGTETFGTACREQRVRSGAGATAPRCASSFCLQAACKPGAYVEGRMRRGVRIERRPRPRESVVPSRSWRHMTGG